jgi:dienelactone hydrolase
MHTKAQYQVGSTTITFNDAGRTGGFGSGGGSGRQIQTEIYYPTTTAGVNAVCASGSFPVIVFGHGFVMNWDAYQPFYAHWAAMGYIVCLPRTEGSLFPSPSHTDFAKDMALVAAKIQAENTLSTSLLYNHVSTSTAIAGHSMGGGCSYLSMQYQTVPITCMFTFAAAQTSPTASAAASSILVPNLLLSGSYDCVVVPDTQVLIYNSLPSSICKTQITLNKAYHCQFAAYNLNCSTGEATCFTLGGIARDTQINRALAYSDAFLNYYLKNNTASWTTFQGYYATGYGDVSSKLQSTANCALGTNTNNVDQKFSEIVYPTSFTNDIIIDQLSTSKNNFITLYNSIGEVLFYTISNQKNFHIDASSFSNGLYLLRINDRVIKLVK